MLRRTLPLDEWSVSEEPNGERALLSVALRRYGVVLAALEAPGVGGTEYVRQLRDGWPDTKVVITSTAATPGEVIESIKEHAFAHFSKPLEPAALAEMIARAVETPDWTDGIEILSATPRWIELRVRCRVVTADRLAQFLRELPLDIPREEREGIATAFREILLNAMEHGGQFDPEQTVEVSYVRTDRSLIYGISDPGNGFSLDDLAHAAISNPDGAPIRHVLRRMALGMRAGGFGIMLARQLMDEVVYSERGNKVLLVKYLTEPRAASPQSGPELTA
jgi:anti-sigma regulatory factor (Ser/Thr protein kinase)/CheY-like chemotaxis protein